MSSLKEMLDNMKKETQPKSTIESVEVSHFGACEYPLEVVVYDDKGNEVFRSNRFFLKGFHGAAPGQESGHVGVTISQLDPFQLLDVAEAISEIVQRPEFIHAYGLAAGLKMAQDILNKMSNNEEGDDGK